MRKSRDDMNYMKMLCRRALELDELYIKIQILTGFTVEQLLEMFMKGYELTPPDPPGSLSEFMLHEDSDVKEETENTNNAHIKIQYNYEELSVSEICKRLTEAEDRAEKAEMERDKLFQILNDVCRDVRAESADKYVVEMQMERKLQRLKERLEGE